MKITAGEWSTDVDGIDGMIKSTVNVEAMAMEKATGETFERLVTLFTQGSRTAVTAFVWVRMKREQPTLRFEDVVFDEDTFSMTYSDAEIEAFKAEAALAEAEAANPPGADEASQTPTPAPPTGSPNESTPGAHRANGSEPSTSPTS